MKLILLRLATLCCEFVSAGGRRSSDLRPETVRQSGEKVDESPKSVATDQEAPRVPIFDFDDARFSVWYYFGESGKLIKTDDSVNIATKLHRMAMLDKLKRIFSVVKPTEELNMCLELDAFNYRIMEIANFLRFCGLKHWPTETLKDKEAIVIGFVNFMGLAHESGDSPDWPNIRKIYEEFIDFQKFSELFSPMIGSHETTAKQIFSTFRKFERLFSPEKDIEEMPKKDIDRLIDQKARKFNKMLFEMGKAGDIGLLEFLGIFAEFEVAQAFYPGKREIIAIFIDIARLLNYIKLNATPITGRLELARKHIEESAKPSIQKGEVLDNLHKIAWMIVREFERLKFMDYCRIQGNEKIQQLVRQNPSEVKRMFIVFHGVDYSGSNAPEKSVIDIIFDEFLFPGRMSENEKAVQLELSEFNEILRRYYTVYPSFIGIPDDIDEITDANSGSTLSAEEKTLIISIND